VFSGLLLDRARTLSPVLLYHELPLTAIPAALDASTYLDSERLCRYSNRYMHLMHETNLETSRMCQGLGFWRLCFTRVWAREETDVPPQIHNALWGSNWGQKLFLTQKI